MTPFFILVISCVCAVKVAMDILYINKSLLCLCSSGCCLHHLSVLPRSLYRFCFSLFIIPRIHSAEFMHYDHAVPDTFETFQKEAVGIETIERKLLSLVSSVTE